MRKVYRPLNPDFIDWSFHFPKFFGIEDNREDKVFANSKPLINPLFLIAYKYPITYLTPETDAWKSLDHSKVPTIVDIGCGYGGLMFELSKEYPDNMILGMEIRDLVANYVVEKVNSIRHNSGNKVCTNIGVVKTNTMKTIHNYFRKESVSMALMRDDLVGEDVLLLRRSALQEAEPPPAHHQHDPPFGLRARHEARGQALRDF